MNSSDAPDAWDQPNRNEAGDENHVDVMSNNFAGLNVHAQDFKPGLNIHAATFVPSTNAMDVQTNGPDKMEEEAPDDWSASCNDRESTDDCGQPRVDDGGGGQASQQESEDQAASNSQEEDEEEVAPRRPMRLASESEKQKEHLNIVFIGHVDAGKSTIGGHIMYLTGQVDKRTLEKYEREAKEKNRESWFLSWALDTNLEERDKGKTVEVGRAYFETENKHFTILDAPGHRSFVPNMIGGASQADVAVLVISARKGEFETGFERGGQTGEHAMLVKTAGVRKLIVVVNKMDDSTVSWDQNRYKEIQDRLTPFLKKCGFNPKQDISFIPVSGLTGYNLKDCNREACPWYNGPSLIQFLDDLPAIKREASGPIRLPVVDRYKDMGTIVLGKVESGSIKKNQVLTLMPNRMQTEVLTLWRDDEEYDQAFAGENIKLKLRNVEEEDVSSGFVLCSPDSLCHTGQVFDAQIVILEHKSIICAGYSAVMHIHTAAEEVSIKHLLCTVDKRTGEKSKTRPRFIKQDQIAIVRLGTLQGIICLEAFKDFQPMGRFTLRDEGRTIAIGKVLKVIA